jgi:hypothetical protein
MEMKMKTRQNYFILGVLLTAIPIIYISIETRNPVFFFGWGILLFIISAFVLRCPHCGMQSFITKSGMNTPIVGSKCRHCGKDY